jgi:LacI family transcriptional regulator
LKFDQSRSVPYKQFKLILQADEEFTQSVISHAATLSSVLAERGCQLEVISCVGFSSEQVAQTILDQTKSDGIAILVENSFLMVNAASAMKKKGIPVVTTNTDLDASVRDAFVGIDNRAAGLIAGFLVGRHLCNRSVANVAVVVETHPVRCHEEREMGFRSILRQRFPMINVIDAVKWDGSYDRTYASAKSLLEQWPEIDGIYNTSGGNHGLAKALEEEGRLGRTLFIAHEVNAVTEPLIRNDAVDYLITQDLGALVMGTVEKLLAISNDEQFDPVSMIRPELLCKHSLPYSSE